MIKDKKKVFMILSVVSILLITIGITYAFFSYSRTGTTENAINMGDITFLYEEIDKQGNGISITDALPTSDENGKQGQAFNFRITSTNSMNAPIPYQITARKATNLNNPLPDEAVKIYLTKVNSNDTTQETEVLLDKYSNLITIEYNDHDDEILWTDQVPALDTSYNQSYRLRMWIDKDVDFSTGQYADKQFSIRINVYGGRAKKDEPGAPEITSVTSSIGTVGEVVDTTLGYSYVTSTLPKGTTSTVLNVTTEDANDQVTVERIDGLGLNDIQSNIQRLSTTHNIPVSLSAGDNYFKIIVKGKSKKKIERIIKIIVQNAPDYTVGDEIYYNGETFFVIEDSYPSQSTVRLITKELINKTTLKQDANYTKMAVSRTNYWTVSGATGTTNLNEDDDINEDKYIIYWAKEYADSIGAVNGEVLTLEEANSLKNAGHADLVHGDSGKYLSDNAHLYYWLGTANIANNYVQAVSENQTIGGAAYSHAATYGTRPVVTLSKSIIEEVNDQKVVEFTANTSVNDSIDIPYSGDYKKVEFKKAGTYKIELWGAQGSDYIKAANNTYPGGYGAYVSGNINIAANTDLYVYVGGKNTKTVDNAVVHSGGYNGGGAGFPYNNSGRGYAGGGATDIRYFNTTPTNSNLTVSSELGLNSRIMVAGAGAGTSYYSTYIGTEGDAGGLEGYNGSFTFNGTPDSLWNNHFEGYGGTQTSGGIGGTGTYCAPGGSGSFGLGGTGVSKCNSSAAGGGAGYYGGGGSGRTGKSAGGGSSFISGHAGCVAIKSASEQIPKIGCDTNPLAEGCSIHYSGLSFTNTKMIDGKGKAWTTTQGTYEQMPNPNGGYYAEGLGHTGNGYARITYLGN